MSGRAKLFLLIVLIFSYLGIKYTQLVPCPFEIDGNGSYCVFGKPYIDGCSIVSNKTKSLKDVLAQNCCPLIQ